MLNSNTEWHLVIIIDDGEAGFGEVRTKLVVSNQTDKVLEGGDAVWQSNGAEL